jgi:hypothetical protein
MFCSRGCIQRLQQSSLARDNPHSICERGYQVRFIVGVWAKIVGDTVVGPCPLPLTAQRYRDFLETVLSGVLEDAPLAVR